MSETVGDWQARKRAQADRIIRRFPSMSFVVEEWQDYNTRFVLVETSPPWATALTIGQLPRDAEGQCGVDLSDDAIAAYFDAEYGVV